MSKDKPTPLLTIKNLPFTVIFLSTLLSCFYIVFFCMIFILYKSNLLEFLLKSRNIFSAENCKNWVHKNANFFSHFFCFDKQYSYQKIFIVPQLPRHYYIVTKGVTVTLSSHIRHYKQPQMQNYFFVKLLILICLATFIFLSLEMITELVATQFSFILY